MLRSPSTHKHLAVSHTLTLLFLALVCGYAETADVDGTLRLATCQFPVSADMRANAEWVRSQIRQRATGRPGPFP